MGSGTAWRADRPPIVFTYARYDQAQARQIFRDLVDMPADIVVQDRKVTVEFHPRAHLPIPLASDLFKNAVTVPWWNGARLQLSTYAGTPGR
jgi:hypothetical protein